MNHVKNLMWKMNRKNQLFIEKHAKINHVKNHVGGKTLHAIDENNGWNATKKQMCKFQMWIRWLFACEAHVTCVRMDENCQFLELLSWITASISIRMISSVIAPYCMSINYRYASRKGDDWVFAFSLHHN